MRKNIRGCFFFTAQRGEGEEEKKKKNKGKAGKTGGSSLFLLVLIKQDTKCSPAEAEEEMNGGRGTTTLATHKTQIHLNIFSHNGFCLFSPLLSAGWGIPRPQGSALERAAMGRGGRRASGERRGMQPLLEGKGKPWGKEEPSPGSRRAQPGAGGARSGHGCCPAPPGELRGDCERPLPPRW